MTEYKHLKIKEFAKVISGFAFKSEDFNNDKGIPVVKITNIKNEELVFEANTQQYVSDAFLTTLDKKYFIEKGDILISLTGSHLSQPNSVVGRVAYNRHSFISLLNQRAGKIIIKRKDIVNNEFLYYYLSTFSVRKEIALKAQGAANQANISPNDVESVQILLPPLATQQKIASILSAYDELIENNKQRIKLLESMAEEIYKEWFVRLRFPNYENTQFIDGLPIGWEEGNLGDLVEFKKGKNITQSTITEGSVPVVAGGLSPAYFHNASNTISPTITVSASGANAGFVNMYYQDIWASDCSYLDKKATKFIFFFYLLMKNKQNEITFLQKGSAQPHVYPKDIMSLKVVKPQKDRIESFETLILPFFEEIKVLSQKNQLLQQTRDLLLPRLISGKLRVEEKLYDMEQNDVNLSMAAELAGDYEAK